MKYTQLKNRVLEYNQNGKQLVFWKSQRRRIKTPASQSQEFAESELAAEVKEATLFAENVPLWFRLKLILLDICSLDACPICGKPRAFRIDSSSTTPVFQTTCGNPVCISKNAIMYRDSKEMSKETRDKHRYAQKELQKLKLQLCQDMLKSYDPKISVDHDVLKAFLTSNLQSRVKNGALFGKDDFKNHVSELHMLLKMTEFITVPKTIQSINDVHLIERAYCALHNKADVGRCAFCGKPTEFVNMQSGYRDSCSECQADKLRFGKGLKTLKQIFESIDRSRYDMLHFPKFVTKEPMSVRCRKCGTISTIWLQNGRGSTIDFKHLCDSCDRYVSNEERELREFIRLQYAGVMKVNDREVIPPLELDIYLPEEKLAFEFDGLYYHNDLVVKANYHILKTCKCFEKEITLIHVFENEWREHTDAVKTLISQLLHSSHQLFTAAGLKFDCDVKKTEAEEFFATNSIQEYQPSSVRYGLRDEHSNLVQLVTFAQPQHKSKFSYELRQHCTRIGCDVSDGLAFCIQKLKSSKQPKSIVSYVDRRWSDGRELASLGFICVKRTSPEYWYFRNEKHIELMSRLKVKNAAKLQSLCADSYDPKRTEAENMRAIGYKRIFDCGNLVFVKTY